MSSRTRRRYVEPEDYVAMVGRIIKAAGVRVGHGDPEHLALLVDLHDDLARAIEVAVAGQRQSGFTWESIGGALGTTRQAALMRWGRR